MAIGNMREIKSILLERYVTVYTVDRLWIGCQQHLIVEWKELTDEQIKEMDGIRGIEWAEKWRDWIFKTIEMSPAVAWRGVKSIV